MLRERGVLSVLAMHMSPMKLCGAHRNFDQYFKVYRKAKLAYDLLSHT